MYIRIYWKTITWAVVMLVIFLAPLNRLPEGPELPYTDKIVHVFLFAVFSFLLYLARIQHAGKNSDFFKHVVLLLIISIAFGAFIELAQLLMAFEREGSLNDVIADLVGALVGGFSAFLFNRYPIN